MFTTQPSNTDKRARPMPQPIPPYLVQVGSTPARIYAFTPALWWRGDMLPYYGSVKDKDAISRLANPMLMHMFSQPTKQQPNPILTDPLEAPDQIEQVDFLNMELTPPPPEDIVMPPLPQVSDIAAPPAPEEPTFDERCQKVADAMKQVPKEDWTNFGPKNTTLEKVIGRKVPQAEYKVALRILKTEAEGENDKTEVSE